MTRMYAVGNGLARLRAELDREAAGRGPVAPPPPPRPAPRVAGDARPRRREPTPASRPASLPAPTAARRPGIATEVVRAPAARRRPAARPWYRREGAVTRVLAVAGAVVTMAGVAMLLVLAAQQGWFGPAARVAAGAALAAPARRLGVRGGEADRRATGAVGQRPGGPRRHRRRRGLPRRRRGDERLRLGRARPSGLVLAGPRRPRRAAPRPALGQRAARRAPGRSARPAWLPSSPRASAGSSRPSSASSASPGGGPAGPRTRPALTLVRVAPGRPSRSLAGAVDRPGRRRRASASSPSPSWCSPPPLVTSTLSVRRDAARRRRRRSAVALARPWACSPRTAPLADPGRTLVLGARAAALLLAAATASPGRPVGPLADAPRRHGRAWLGTPSPSSPSSSGAPERFVATGLLLLALAGLAAAGATRSRTRARPRCRRRRRRACSRWAAAPPRGRHGIRAPGAHDMVAALARQRPRRGGRRRRAVGRRRRSAASAATCGSSRDRRRVGARPRARRPRCSSPSAPCVGAAARATRRSGFTIGHAVATVTWMLAAAWLLLRGLERSARRRPHPAHRSRAGRHQRRQAVPLRPRRAQRAGALGGVHRHRPAPARHRQPLRARPTSAAGSTA